MFVDPCTRTVVGRHSPEPFDWFRRRKIASHCQTTDSFANTTGDVSVEMCHFCVGFFGESLRIYDQSGENSDHEYKCKVHHFADGVAAFSSLATVIVNLREIITEMRTM